MAVLIKHSKVSTIPDTDNTDLVRPSDWNADHVVVGAAESGANSDITSLSGITGGISTPDFVQYDTTATATIALGKERWNATTGTLAFGIIDGTTEVNIGQQMYAQVVNAEAVTITKGQAVYLYQATGNKASVKLAYNTGDATSAKTLGLAAQDIAAGATGFITTVGVLDKLNTGAYNEGDTLYLGATAGSLTATKPAAPNHLVYIGVVERANNGNGQIFVRVQNGYELDEIHDVSIVNPTTGQTLVYNQSTDLWSNSNAPTIIGGSINNTPIGATTPAAGTFTTITGQTEVLRGTGQNLVLRSDTLATSPWFNSGLTSITNNTTDLTDPNGTNTATKIVATGTGSAVGQPITLAATVNTGSIYLRTLSGTATCQLIVYLASSPFTNIGTTNVTITSTWQRFTVTTSTANAASYNLQINNISASTIYAWGAQLEMGSVANTYIPTTTTAVYGTPNLSFSGVAGIGLESNGALYVQPAGTGAIQAQATTSTAAGGNARGANAVDWQTNRANAAQVASAQYSVITGGTANTSNGFGAIVAGGRQNSSGGGYTFIGGGELNAASGFDSSIVGGISNTSAGYFNFIGNGASNSGTSGSAVTTQATTTVTSGSTAVTLSGSNANIKVGQLITGTGMANYTYVAAISGTSLTLSQNANASGSPTLSFFTPHGVVVGGGNNQATGAYSFIGGGGDAGSTTNRNTASGDWSFVGGGIKNTASGIASFIGGGGASPSAFGNTSSGTSSFVGAGFGNTNSAFGGVICGGYSNTVNSQYGAVLGGTFGTTRGIVGLQASPLHNNPLGQSLGVSQAAMLVLARQTTDATATVITSDTNAAGTTNQVILPNNSAYYFKGSVIANVTGAANGAAWSIEGAIMRGANAASTVLIDTPSVNRVAASTGATAWTIAVTADTTNGGLAITVTGAAATTIRWVAKVETTEVTF